MSEETKICPYCAEEIRIDDNFCMDCGREVGEILFQGRKEKAHMHEAFYSVFAFAVLLASCWTPTDQELGQSGLLAMPVVMFAGLAFHYLHFRLWKEVSPTEAITWRPSGVFFVIGTFLVAGAGWQSLLDEGVYVGAAMIFGGVSYITILFIVTWVWILINPRNAFTWSPVAVMILIILPALLAAFSSSSYSSLQDLLLNIWTLPVLLIPIIPIRLIALIVKIYQKRRKSNGRPSG